MIPKRAPKPLCIEPNPLNYIRNADCFPFLGTISRAQIPDYNLRCLPVVCLRRFAVTGPRSGISDRRAPRGLISLVEGGRLLIRLEAADELAQLFRRLRHHP